MKRYFILAVSACLLVGCAPPPPLIVKQALSADATGTGIGAAQAYYQTYDAVVKQFRELNGYFPSYVTVHCPYTSAKSIDEIGHMERHLKDSVTCNGEAKGGGSGALLAHIGLAHGKNAADAEQNVRVLVKNGFRSAYKIEPTGVTVFCDDDKFTGKTPDFPMNCFAEAHN